MNITEVTMTISLIVNILFRFSVPISLIIIAFYCRKISKNLDK